MPFNPEQIKAVKGFLDPAEARHLYDMALIGSRLGPCLEVGSYCGKSAVCLGSACRENGGTLFSIDHHGGSEEQQPGEEYFDPELFDPRAGKVNSAPFFLATIKAAGLTDTIVPLICSSATAARSWGTPLGLVFIDGGHSLEAAYTDYICWAGHIRPGGFLLIHDIFEDPATGGQAPHTLFQLALASGLFSVHSRIKTLGVLQRLQPGAPPPVPPV